MKESASYIKLPQFIIAGAAKSGTTSLSRYLSAHPEIYIPPQEMNYFSFAGNAPDFTVKNNRLLDDFEHYKSFYRFSHNPENIVPGEKSVSYMYSPWCRQVIENIHSIHPLGEELKIIIILRHPVERMYSQYLFNTQSHENLPFGQAISEWQERKKEGWVPAYDYVGTGYYAESVKAFLDNFNHVSVFLFDDLKKSPQSLLKKIYRSLGVDNTFIPEQLGEPYNASGLPGKNILGQLYKQKWLRRMASPAKTLIPGRALEHIMMRVKSRALQKPDLSPSLKQELTELYKDDIRELEKIINRDLSHWSE